jgi:hypothetical protein
VTSVPRPLALSPTAQSAAFTPPPTGVVTLESMSRDTIAYWRTIRIAWLTGYRIEWVIPGRNGSGSGSRSVWNLDVRVQPVETIFPSRTARYSVEPYVLVSGRPHIEPPQGTRVTVRFTLAQPRSLLASVTPAAAPTGMGETAAWLPTPATYSPGEWLPSGGAPPAPDAGIVWVPSEFNAPRIETEFSYALRGTWPVVTALSVRDSTYLRLDGMSLYSGTTPLPPVTLFVVAAVETPPKYWGSLLRSVEPDGSRAEDQVVPRSNLDLRLMPDGNLHPYTHGWQAPLPLVGDNHALSLFGFTLDPATGFLRLFTIDRELRMVEMHLPYQFSATSRFVLGRSAEDVFGVHVLDIRFFRGTMTADRTEDIASQLDGAYGITPRPSQEQA